MNSTSQIIKREVGNTVFATGLPTAAAATGAACLAWTIGAGTAAAAAAPAALVGYGIFRLLSACFQIKIPAKDAGTNAHLIHIGKLALLTLASAACATAVFYGVLYGMGIPMTLATVKETSLAMLVGLAIVGSSSAVLAVGYAATMTCITRAVHAYQIQKTMKEIF